MIINTSGQFNEFVNRQNLDEDSKKFLIESTTKILKRTDLLDNEDSSNCQLVVGEVQSGKTMSFTALTALAHENGFPIVIVLAGTKKQLLSQTTNRLREDLKADGNGGPNPWVMVKKLNKKDRAKNVNHIQKILSNWKHRDVPSDFKPTVIIPILKHQGWIDEVSEIMRALKSGFSIDKYPVLIIDDEGDQAGLNLYWQNDQESTIYASIKNLRKTLVKHSYVMYTATPQGPLLISLQDALSPTYVTLLKSGKDYLGGEALFGAESKFFKEISQQEVQAVFDTSPSASPPKSLLEALAFYLLALNLAQKRSNPKPLSMLIHPSVGKNLHVSYENWVEKILKSWQVLLENSSEKSYLPLKRDFFEPAAKELAKTTNLDSEWNLDQVLKEVKWLIPYIDIRVINSDRSNIDTNEWMSKAGWILIGGNKLERGFTIENLAITYMPRSTGSRNVDVIQQRGRFFGYKRKYQDLLRGWFFEDNIQAYIDYIEHEKSIRSQLGKIDESNEKLSNWRRRFLLDPTYHAVRSQIISLGINHKRLSIFKQHMLFDPDIGLNTDKFIEQIYSLVNNEYPVQDDNRPDRKNYFCNIDLANALELLIDWPMSPENRAELDDIIWAIQSIPETDKFDGANLVLMDWEPDKRVQHVRDRSMLRGRADPNKLPEKQLIANIFQGESPQSKIRYPGDIAMKLANNLNIQVHIVRPKYENAAYPVVAALALLLPPNTKGFITEIAR